MQKILSETPETGFHFFGNRGISESQLGLGSLREAGMKTLG